MQLKNFIYPQHLICLAFFLLSLLVVGQNKKDSLWLNWEDNSKLDKLRVQALDKFIWSNYV